MLLMKSPIKSDWLSQQIYPITFSHKKARENCGRRGEKKFATKIRATKSASNKQTKKRLAMPKYFDFDLKLPTIREGNRFQLQQKKMPRYLGIDYLADVSFPVLFFPRDLLLAALKCYKFYNKMAENATK